MSSQFQKNKRKRLVHLKKKKKANKRNVEEVIPKTSPNLKIHNFWEITNRTNSKDKHAQKNHNQPRKSKGEEKKSLKQRNTTYR